ncbi:MAG: HEAT repeat domain-containing protein [Planctomycetota bacterium]
MRSRSTRRFSSALALLVSLAIGGACRSVDPKVWNLEQLHDESGRHRYTGALEGDFEYFLRHEFTRLFSGVGFSTSFAQKSASEIEDPSTECLDVLLELEDLVSSDPRTFALQVVWFARLCVEDPARLSRERSVYALGRLGRALEVGMPVKVPANPPAAGAPAGGAALSSLVAAAKPWTDGSATKGASELDLAAAAQVVQGLVLDLDGARRALDVVAELFDKLPSRATEPIVELARDLERRCVREALAAALIDKDPWVRAAAVEGAVECGGPRVLDSILAQIERDVNVEPAPEVLIRVMRVVRTRGLGPDEGDVRRERWTRSIYRLMNLHPDPAVRIAAMEALGKVAGAGFASLREEDWQAWWQTRPSSHSTPESGTSTPGASTPGASTRSGAAP